MVKDSFVFSLHFCKRNFAEGVSCGKSLHKWRWFAVLGSLVGHCLKNRQHTL